MDKQFKVGDRVVINNSPFSFNGSLATVKGFDGEYYICELDSKKGAYHLYHVELTPYKEEQYTLHNRHSDMICWVMENEEVGGWYGKLKKNTNSAIPFPQPYKIFLKTNEKEIFFSLMWVVDDETLDALIEEMKRE